MSTGEELHAEMVHARQNDGISMIFGEDSLSGSGLRLSRSRSGSGSSRSSRSGRRGRGSYRGRYRSPSTSSSLSSSRSRSCPRSRSHPRCHRRSSRCRCDGHNRYGRGRYRRSPPRRHRAYSRSYSRSPSSDHSYRYGRGRYRRSPPRRHRAYSRSCSRSPSSGRSSRSRICRPHFRSNRLNGRSRRFSRSPSTSYRSHSRSRSSRCSVNLTVDDKRELLKVAEANAKKLLSVDEVELPESVTQILPEPPVKPKQVPTELRVRRDSESASSQSNEEPDDMPSMKMSPNRKTISFSVKNSVAKPTVTSFSCVKLTARVDSFDSRKPYGHWVPVRTRQTSVSRKHTLSKSH